MAMKRTQLIGSILTVLLVLGAFTPQLSAQIISKKGTTSANFLLIPVGTRAAALGGATTATVSDGSAMYWNVGALAGVRSTELYVEHSQWIADLQHTYVGFSLPAAGGTLGLSVVAFTMDDMEET